MGGKHSCCGKPKEEKQSKSKETKKKGCGGGGCCGGCNKGEKRNQEEDESEEEMNPLGPAEGAVGDTRSEAIVQRKLAKANHEKVVKLVEQSMKETEIVVKKLQQLEELVPERRTLGDPDKKFFGQVVKGLLHRFQKVETALRSSQAELKLEAELIELGRGANVVGVDELAELLRCFRDFQRQSLEANPHWTQPRPREEEATPREPEEPAKPSAMERVERRHKRVEKHNEHRDRESARRGPSADDDYTDDSRSYSDYSDSFLSEDYSFYSESDRPPRRSSNRNGSSGKSGARR